MADNQDVLGHIGPRICSYRKLHGLTQKVVAEALGIDDLYYGQIERGERQLSLPKLIDVCNFFHITLDNLIVIEYNNIDTDPLKESALHQICEMLESYSGAQLAAIKNMIMAVSPLIK